MTANARLPTHAQYETCGRAENEKLARAESSGDTVEEGYNTVEGGGVAL
jgi:hypothetical protein